jgi:RNase P subunit RPR2
MPQRIICSKCGDILYEGDLLKSVQDVIKKFEGRCPSCGKELDFEVDKIFIKANEK